MALVALPGKNGTLLVSGAGFLGKVNPRVLCTQAPLDGGLSVCWQAWNDVCHGEATAPSTSAVTSDQRSVRGERPSATHLPQPGLHPACLHLSRFLNRLCPQELDEAWEASTAGVHSWQPRVRLEGHEPSLLPLADPKGPSGARNLVSTLHGKFA